MDSTNPMPSIENILNLENLEQEKILSKSTNIFEENKFNKPLFKKNKTIDKLEKLETSHKHRFDKMHSPSNLYNTFSPTHFSPKNLSPIKKKQSRFAFSSTNSLLSLKSAGISQEFDKINESNIKLEIREMTENLKEFLLQSFKKHFIFGDMDEGILDNILSSMKCFSLEDHQILLNEGESTEYLYIIEKGIIASIKGDEQKEEEKKKIHQYKNGEILLDDLFFNNLPSQAKYVSLSNTMLWGLPNTQISLIILQITEKKYNENRTFIDPIHFFSKLTETQKDSLAYNMKNLKFMKNTTIMKEDLPGLNFYILKTGLLIVTAKGKFMHYLKPGDCFGENVFLEKNRSYTVIVESEVAECLSMTKKTILELFDEDFEKVIYKNLVRKTITNSEKFSKLTSIQIDHTVNMIKYVKYSKDEQIFPNFNDSHRVIYLLLDGKITTLSGKTEVHEGVIIGEECIADHEYKLPILLAKEDVLIGECDLFELEKELGGKLNELIDNNKFCHENLILFQKKQDIANSTLYKVVKSADIKILKLLGEGFSGIVLLASYENKLYALKIISKGWIIEKELEEYIRNEKEIYYFIDFDFITKLCYTFKDDLSIYFLLEFVNGMELFTVLCNLNRFTSEEARFYIGILILCLQYLHNKGIIHRDIKPENIIIDSTGYIKLCDLGIAKLMTSNQTRTYTLLGTKFYIAPEMIVGKGYSFPADFWSLGICLYEFVCGDVPFGANQEEPYNIYQSIVLDKLSFPSFFKDKSTKDLIKGLLVKSPEKRLGKTFGEIKGHQFFMNFNWDDLMNRKMQPPLVPKNEELTLKSEEVELLNKKTTSLSQLLSSPEIMKIREITQMVKSDFLNWDNIF